MDTTARSLELLALLGARAWWPGAKLARRLEVTERTLRRDMARLRLLGYPIEATSGPHGGYRFGAGGRLPPLVLDDDEAVAVAVALRHAAGQAGSGMEAAALTALTKLDQVLPVTLRERVAAVRAVTVDLRNPRLPSADLDALVALAMACRRPERVRFTYEDGSGRVTSRLSEPYRLVTTERRWYLVAYDTGRRDWRTFRVDRITELRSTGVTFTRRDPPDPGALVAEGVAVRAWETQASVRLPVALEENGAAYTSDRGGAHCGRPEPHARSHRRRPGVDRPVPRRPALPGRGDRARRRARGAPRHRRATAPRPRRRCCRRSPRRRLSAPLAEATAHGTETGPPSRRGPSVESPGPGRRWSVFDSQWLDIAIGVVTIWVLLSIVVSAVNELGNRALAIRAKQLWKALHQMLDDPREAKGVLRNSLSLWFWRGRPQAGAVPEPLSTAAVAAAVAPGATLPAPTGEPTAGGPGEPPAANAGGVGAPSTTVMQQLYATSTIQALENHPKNTRKTRIHNIPSSIFSQAFIELAIGSGRWSALSATQIETFISHVPNRALQRQLLALWTTASNDIAHFQQNVERWFNGQMDRLSAIYRSQVRLVMIAIGAIVVVIGFGFGVRTDSLGLVSDLQRDSAFRAGLSDLGTQISSAGNAGLAARGCPPPSTLPGRRRPRAPRPSPPRSASPRGSAPTSSCRWCSTARIRRRRGSSRGRARCDRDRRDFVGRLGDLWTWRHVVGLAATAIALAFGASFWFNVLGRLVGLRQKGQSAPSA